MIKGMLWFNNDPKLSIKERLLIAVQYYKEKYQEIPNTCHINYNEDIKESSINDIRLIKDIYILPNHFWIGINDIL